MSLRKRQVPFLFMMIHRIEGHIDDDQHAHPAITQAIENLLDILDSRLRKKTLEQVAQTLLPGVFTLRIEALKWLREQGEGIHDLLEAIDETVIDYQQTLQKTDIDSVENVALSGTVHYSLVKNITAILDQYQKIARPILESAGIAAFENLPSLRDDSMVRPGLNDESFEFFTADLTMPHGHFYRELTHASLNLELGFIIADQILSNQLSLEPARIEQELIPFLLQNIRRFGAYAMYLDIWTPDENDDSQLTTDSRILKAKMDLESGNTKTVLEEEFFNMLDN